MAAGSDALGHFGLTREALREPDRELRRGKRLRQEVALRRVAAELDEAIPDPGGLDVHGDRQVEALLAPARALLERLLDDEERERPDEAGVLCDGDEDVGRDEAALRLLPADERLDAAHRAVGEPRLRLVVEHELAVLDRAPEL